MAKLSIDQEKCIRCGSCEAIAPEVFALDEDFKGKVKIENPTSEQMEKVKEAIDNCVPGAIKLE